MAATAGKSLLDQLGGIEGASRLAEQFATNLTASPAVTKFLDNAAITGVKNGLVNEIAKSSGTAPPNAGADLKSSLSGKGLDAGAMSAISGALGAAASTLKLSPATASAVLGLVEPILKSVLGQ
jgi:hypothetical protein